MSASGLRGRTCVVTGASAGIGRAIAIALARAGATVCAVARRRAELERTAAGADGAGAFSLHDLDVTADDKLLGLARQLTERGDIDVLVHGAGIFSSGSLETASVADLDRLYATNVRAPYLLSQALLPALRAVEGQIVFINSTVIHAARAGVSQYTATKHALKGIADAVREELNPHGVRVVSVYPGRTATDTQVRIHAGEGRAYRPENLLQPEDVAAVVLHTLTLPRSAEVTDVRVRPMRKS